MKKTLTVFLLFLFLCSCLFPSAALADGTEAEWVPAYREILASAAEERLAQIENDIGGGFDLTVECSYVLYDIDKDGSPELIVKTGTCEADYLGKVYTWRDHSALFAGDVSLGHCVLYSYPEDNGLIFHWGHMGAAFADCYQLLDGELVFKVPLFEDDLNARLQEDPDAEYIDPGSVVPGAVSLMFVPSSLTLPMLRYDELRHDLEGIFTVSDLREYPDQDPEFFNRIINGNGQVCAVQAHSYANDPGPISFRELLKKDVAAEWMGGDLRISGMQTADLNGDGKLECILQLTSDENGDRMHFYLSEQDGTVYAYLENYTSDELKADRNGNLLMVSPYYTQLERLIFDKEECFFIYLPADYYSE